MRPTEKTTTIEQTSKRFKAMQLWAVLIVAIGVVASLGVGSMDLNRWFLAPPLLCVLGGFAVYFYARLMAWWHHG